MRRRNRSHITLRKETTGGVDRKLLFLALLLTGIGLIAVADASAPSALSAFSDKYFFAKQQAMWGALGIACLFVFSHVNYKFWSKIAVPVFGVGIFFLLMALIPAFAPSLLGARRWIVLGPVTFQPSELMKIGIALYMAKVAESQKELMSYLVPLGIVIFLVMLQPDLGTTIVLSGIGFAQLFLAGVNFVHLAGIGLTGVVGSTILILTSSYRRDRLMTFLQQTTDPLGKGYHIRQILYALGSGGVIGVGLGQSRQKYLFLPEAATDSIFAVIAEEIGFLGATLLIAVIFAFIYRGLMVVRDAPDTFSKVLAGGIVTWIGGQSFINIAAMVALVPLTGIPLPFISYGGSSLVTVLIGTGILLNISRYAKTNSYKSR